jgi:FkbM family methyltransferase
LQFTKDLFKARISAGLVPAQSHEVNGSQAERVQHKFPVVDLGVLLPLPEDDTFIRESYRRVLGRECDPASLVNCVEMLRRHTPRRVLLQQLVNSEEAKRRGVAFEGLPAAPAAPQPRRSIISSLRSLGSKGFDFLARAWHAPFVSLDQKLTLILRELANRIDSVSEKADQNLWTVSEKLDAYGVGIAREEEHGVVMRAQVASNNEALAGIADRISAMSAEVSRLSAAYAAFRNDYRRTPLLLGGNNIFITELDGFVIAQPGEEWRMAAFHALRGVMEPGLVRRLQQLLKPGMTFVDVGANVGVVTLHAAVRVAPNGKVISFEPTPRTFEILKDNVQVNGFLESGMIDLRCAAVSDVVGEANLSVYAANSGHNTLFGVESDSRITVPTTTLDSALAHNSIDIVKIDVEGAEPLVLRGMRNTVDANRHIIILIEFAPAHLRRAGVEPSVFLEELRSSGFAIRIVDDATGNVSEPDLSQLVNAFSVNLELTRVQ